MRPNNRDALLRTLPGDAVAEADDFAHQKFEVGHRLMIGDYVIELVEPPRRVPK